MRFELFDINCDLGEGITDDDGLMPFIDSCNIACGGHYGDINSIKATLLLAKKNNVKVGAHPSFPDRVNFGRKVMTIPDEVLKTSIKKQITDFKDCTKDLGIDLNHVKLHGALYNLAAIDDNIANMVIAIFSELNLKCSIYAPPNSILAKKAIDKGITVMKEAFIDRAYNADGTLVNRSEKGALLTDMEKVWQQLKRLIVKNEVIALSGELIPIYASTFCIHGDTENALKTLQFIHKKRIGEAS